MARVEPGVILAALQAEVEKHGLFYPPDPNSLELCTIGGNVAENAGGPRALKYGVTREYVLGLRAVLPTGEVIRTGHRSIKGVAGYDLTALLVGSEGTLAVITEIMVKLLPRPRHVATALVAFADVDAAARAVSRVLAQGVIPRCLELMDDVSLAAIARTSPGRFPAGAGALLLVETDGNDEEQVFDEIVRVADLVAADAAGEVLVAQDEAQRREIWEVRRYLSVNLKALHPLKLSEDVAVPRSKIPEMVARAKAIGAAARPARWPPTATPATATSTATSCTTRRGAARGWTRRWRPSCAPRSSWAGPSPASTAWGWPSATSWSWSRGGELVALQRRHQGGLRSARDPQPGKIFPAA